MPSRRARTNSKLNWPSAVSHMLYARRQQAESRSEDVNDNTAIAGNLSDRTRHTAYRRATQSHGTGEVHIRLYVSRNALCRSRGSNHREWQVAHAGQDRKSTRLNSSHQIISYAVFSLKKKTHTTYIPQNLNHTAIIN